jgi:hypothetical protein
MWMWSNRLIVVVAIALVVVVAIDALRSSGRKRTASPKSVSTAVAQEKRPPRCAEGDMVVGIDVRHPTSAQASGRFAAPRRRAVATIVLRNVGSLRCHWVWGFRLAVTDRIGRPLARWLDAGWFVDDYIPGAEKTFSLPGVSRCDRPGPFVAFAVVGPYSARRGDLSRREIAC